MYLLCFYKSFPLVMFPYLYTSSVTITYVTYKANSMNSMERKAVL